jgi:hypothetical protein
MYTHVRTVCVCVQAGRADLTQYWTRWLLENRYTDQPSGLPGAPTPTWPGVGVCR